MRCGHSRGRRRWDKGSMETYALPYIKQTARGNSLHDSGSANQSSVTTTRGEGGERGEGGCRGRGQKHTYGRFMLMYDRNQHNIVKQSSSN